MIGGSEGDAICRHPLAGRPMRAGGMHIESINASQLDHFIKQIPLAHLLPSALGRASAGRRIKMSNAKYGFTFGN